MIKFKKIHKNHNNLEFNLQKYKKINNNSLIMKKLESLKKNFQIS